MEQTFERPLNCNASKHNVDIIRLDIFHDFVG